MCKKSAAEVSLINNPVEANIKDVTIQKPDNKNLFFIKKYIINIIDIVGLIILIPSKSPARVSLRFFVKTIVHTIRDTTMVEILPRYKLCVIPNSREHKHKQ